MSDKNQNTIIDKSIKLNVCDYFFCKLFDT